MAPQRPHHSRSASLLPAFFLLISAESFKISENSSSKSIEDHPNWRLLSSVEDGCGVSESDRIIGGVDAALGQFPWIARLGYRPFWSDKNSLIRYRCGGTLVSRCYVVTAAHCIKTSGLKLVAVRLGEHNDLTEVDCFNGVCNEAPMDILVEKVITHEQYNQPKLANDIGLIRLQRPVEFTAWVSPICMARGSLQSKLGHSAEVAGWGFIKKNSQIEAHILQTVHVPVLSLERCKIEYTAVINITREQLCAGGLLNKDSCSGDSGGALMQARELDETTPRYFLAGVVSFGPTVCGSPIPAIYSNVESYTRWILDRIEP